MNVNVFATEHLGNRNVASERVIGEEDISNYSSRIQMSLEPQESKTNISSANDVKGVLIRCISLRNISRVLISKLQIMKIFLIYFG